MPETTDNQEEQGTCFERFKIRSSYWWKIFVSPVEYPAEEARGQGWCDVCNATCGVICFAPKAAILILATPHICCCMKLEDLQK